jgi:hypothetical protein
MGQTQVRYIKYENMFHLTIVPLHQRDNLTFQKWEYNNLISNCDGPSTLDSISGGLGF